MLQKQTLHIYIYIYIVRGSTDVLSSGNSHRCARSKVEARKAMNPPSITPRYARCRAEFSSFISYVTLIITDYLTTASLVLRYTYLLSRPQEIHFSQELLPSLKLRAFQLPQTLRVPPVSLPLHLLQATHAPVVLRLLARLFVFSRNSRIVGVRTPSGTVLSVVATANDLPVVNNEELVDMMLNFALVDWSVHFRCKGTDFGG